MKYIVECFPDFHFVKVLTGVSRKQIDHAGNISEVIKRLLKTENAIGLIDEDPQGSKPSFFYRKFSLSKDFQNFAIYVESKNSNPLIVLKPRLEGWILKAAKKSKLSLKKFGLPETEEKLHKVINQKLNLEKFKKVLEELLKRKNKDLIKIKELLKKGVK